MDYEKAYKESFGVAKCLHEAGDTATKKQMERLFPQLVESDDERIRKALIDALKVSETIGELKFRLPYPTREECLAYLEKQKEQKHPNGCFTCDEYKKGYEEGRRNGFTAGYNKAMKEVGQKEQKPVVTHGETYRVDTLGTQQVIAGKMPQKPAEWSEEDEKIRKALIWHLKADVDFVSNGVTKAECIAYLDKQKAQKQEWSDEDKRILKGIIGLVDHNQHYNVSNKEMLAWLKSLRNRVGKEFLQPHWKPSEDEERLINTSISFLKDFADKGYENAVECIDWLKSKLNGNSGK